MATEERDTEDTQEKVEFTNSQQAFIDALIGKTRIEARDKAAADTKVLKDAEAREAEAARLENEKKFEELSRTQAVRIQTLEGLEKENTVYRGLVDTMLADSVEQLGDAAKTAVEALPKTLASVERLAWLNANVNLFREEVASPVGTPKRGTAVGNKVKAGIEKLAIRL